MHRSDGSGTTFIFATFLSRMSADWKNNVGAATSVDWPVGIGAKGNEGVAGNVAQTAGAIGYVEYAYAKVNHLTYAKMINKDGKTVSPTVDCVQAAAAIADWDAAANNGFYIILVDQAGADVVADHGDDLHPHLQAAGRSGRVGRGAEVLQVGLCERRPGRAGPRLRAAAGQRRAGHRGKLEADPGFGNVIILLDAYLDRGGGGLRAPVSLLLFFCGARRDSFAS